MNFDEKDVRVRVAGIVISDKRILLISHKKDGNEYWLLPGGGVSFLETLEEALKREFNEELNIDVAVQKIALVCDSIDPDEKRHIINICFHCSYEGGDYRLGDDNRLSGYGYFNAQELKQLKIYPPINDELVDIIRNKPQTIYLGKLWLDE